LLEHGSLDDLIEQRKRVPEQRLLQTGIQIASGLRAAQAKGLIHRDIKPANILFANEYTAKIGDFGLVGVTAHTAEARGEIWGTPYYVAPERLDRQVEDFRSDIYSLGATLYHALAGRPPIEGDTTSATELRKLKQQRFDLRRIAPDVSTTTAEVLQRMIAPAPAERFASYNQLIEELERALNATATAIEAPKIQAPTVTRKSRRVAGIATVTLVFVGIGVFVFTWNSKRSNTKGGVRTADNAHPQASGTQRTGVGAAAESPGHISWEAALAGYKQHLALYDFAGARKSIQAAQVTDRSAVKSQEAMAMIAQWLVDWKEKLILDLNKKQFRGALTDTNGVQYTGIVGANADQIMLKTRYGVIGARWPTLSPSILLGVSASFISPEAHDRADRQWLCAAFASQTGQREEGRRFAEAAARAKSEYRRQISLLLSPPSRSR
ncbi:MAG TPA: serine/threonine-protein kinase, partial [Chthoniobacterales bacterium]|nr:serine/threonine-protein kinase [Chthoniobacterales bacterium]